MQVPRITDPESLPVDATGAALPPVARERLDAAGLRAQFERIAGWQSAHLEELHHLPGSWREAAVLVPLVARDDGVTVLFTRRSAHMTSHAGQISFPGGGREAGDADAVATALREASEEIGLDATRTEILGVLPEYMMTTGFRVTPVVALVHPPFTVTVDDIEVAEIFEVPLAFLMTPANHEVRTFRWPGGARRFLSIPYKPAGRAEAYFIWGATAAMLRNLYHFLCT